jgi:acyl-CoA synthetase (AMP-forming)/AMP-acid ligase II
VLEPGRIGLVRSRIIDGLSGYLDDDVTSREFLRDGYFYSGDLGLFGPDGRLSLRGRASDVVNVLGAKIATEPIERKLQDRLGAQGVCVVSIPGREQEEEIHVVIEITRRIDPAEMEAAARDELAVFGHTPIHVSHATKLPRNANGKVARLVLKEQLTCARDGGAPPGVR